MPSWFSGLRKTRSRIAEALRSVFSSAKPDAETVEEMSDLLIMADVPLPLVQQLSKEWESAATRSETPAATFRRVLVSALDKSGPPDWAAFPSPTVILLVGVNGSGKTTTAAKLAQLALNSGRKPLLGAADTFRAAGSNQLKIWADRLGVPVVVGATGGDAAATAYDALDSALARQCDTVIVDTAGRMHTRTPLMQELQKTRNAISKRLPGVHLQTWIVLDAMLGQNAISQARLFNEATPLDGAIVSKLDGSSKAGFLFAIQKELGLPVLYAGLGEAPDDLTPFSAEAFVDALLQQEAR